VDAMHPSSSRAGTTTDKSFKLFLCVGSLISVLCCFVCVSWSSFGLLMVSPTGFIQFQQTVHCCRKLLLSVRQRQHAGILGGGDGIVEASGFGVSGGQGSDRRSLFILG